MDISQKQLAPLYISVFAARTPQHRKNMSRVRMRVYWSLPVLGMARTTQKTDLLLECVCIGLLSSAGYGMDNEVNTPSNIFSIVAYPYFLGVA
jgi:hypothetical protein